MRKFFIAVIVAVILLTGFIIIRLGSALNQESNVIGILICIAKLEFTGSEYEAFSTTTKTTKYISKTAGNSENEVVKEYMATIYWDFVEEMGSGLIFERGDDVVVIPTRQYSKHYFIWSVPAEASR